jgi:cobaltochelatase CobN
MQPQYETSPITEIRRADGVVKKVRIEDGHLFVCHGCCCGRVEKGFPALPLDEFKRQWKERGIRRRFHLTISGCLGPCSLANVVLIMFRGVSVWLHSIGSDQDVTDIYDYVEQMLVAERYLDPPPPLAGRHFQRYLVDTPDKLFCGNRRLTTLRGDAVDAQLPERC